MRTFNDVAGKHAEEVLLDDVGFVIFDAYEPVRDVEPVADFLRPRLDKVELSRVGEPAGDQRRRVFGPRTLAKAGRDERPKRDSAGEARLDRRRVLSAHRLHEPHPDRMRHAASLGRPVILAPPGRHNTSEGAASFSRVSPQGAAREPSARTPFEERA